MGWSKVQPAYGINGKENKRVGNVLGHVVYGKNIKYKI